MARHDPKHQEAQRTHALRRLYQRHGLSMGLLEYSALCQQIRDGKHAIAAMGRSGGTLHVVRHHGKTVVAVFSAETSRIVTFLPAGTPHELRAAAETLA